MGLAVGETLAIALAIAICPIPIVAVVLLLTSPSGRTNGPLFVLGWLTGLAVVGTAVLLIAGPTSASESGGPATWVSWAKIALALLLVRMGVRELRGRTSVGHTATPKWMGAIDSATPVRAFGFGALPSGVNPKSLILAVAGAATIAATGIPGAQQAGAYAIFALVGTVGVATPVVISLAMGQRSAVLLERLKLWMLEHNAIIMAVLCFLIAAKLLGDGVASLTA
jgi:threonine/homoserine/homoserine lactone efflux protein